MNVSISAIDGDQLKHVFKQIGVWRADVILSDISIFCTIIVPNAKNKRAIKAVFDRHLFLSATILVRESEYCDFKKRKKYEYIIA